MPHVKQINRFDQKLKAAGYYPLKADKISTLQVNMGYKCNLSCAHCHIDASPYRTEEMSFQTVDNIIDILRKHDEITTLDVTGGSPEYNPCYKWLLKIAADLGKKVISRSNLAIITELGMDSLPYFWAANKIKIIGSLPCYSAEGVDGQRGDGTYDKAVSVLKRLNGLGYGHEGTGLEIDLMFNPAKEGVAPDQRTLEDIYRDKLKALHGITFNHLTTLSNMPIGRLGNTMSEVEKEVYIKQLEEQFNPETVKNLMCRHLISVSPEGKLYDCDFWQAIHLPVKNGSSSISEFDYNRLKNREIMTLPLCLMCTAGAGASCSGALA